MKLLLNNSTPDETLVIATEIDEDGDINILFDGVKVGFFSHNNGSFVTWYINDADRDRLALKGVEFRANTILHG